MELNKGIVGIDLNDKINARTYLHLPDKPSRGSFINAGFQPTVTR